jgi:hypothetical protein
MLAKAWKNRLDRLIGFARKGVGTFVLDYLFGSLSTRAARRITLGVHVGCMLMAIVAVAFILSHSLDRFGIVTAIALAVAICGWAGAYALLNTVAVWTCLIGTMLLGCHLIDRPSLRIDAALISGRWLSVLLSMAIVACVLRFGAPAPAAENVLDDDRNLLRKALSRLPVLLRIGASGIVVVAIVLLTLRPTDGNAARILSDDYAENTPANAVSMLGRFVEAKREAAQAGCNIAYDTARIQNIVQKADAKGVSPEFAAELM